MICKKKIILVSGDNVLGIMAPTFTLKMTHQLKNV